MTPGDSQIGTWLRKSAAGDGDALDRVMALLYEELRARAEACMRRERPGHTLQATALINEVYLKFRDSDDLDCKDHATFCSLAALTMRRVLVDHARARNAAKRGGQRKRQMLADDLSYRSVPNAELLALDEALKALGKLSPRMVSVVELRFFGGLSLEEIAAVLETTTRTVNRDWTAARTFLYGQLS